MNLSVKHKDWRQTNVYQVCGKWLTINSYMDQGFNKKPGTVLNTYHTSIHFIFMEKETIMIPISQVSKLRLGKKAESLVQGQPTSKWQSQDLNQEL